MSVAARELHRLRRRGGERRGGAREPAVGVVELLPRADGGERRRPGPSRRAPARWSSSSLYSTTRARPTRRRRRWTSSFSEERRAPLAPWTVTRLRSRASAVSARAIAAQVLVRVDKDAAFAAAALDTELSRAVQMAPRDRGLSHRASRTATFRVRLWIDARIERHAKKRASRGLDSARALTCEIAAYQRLLPHASAPAFAAVSEAVDLVRAVSGARVAAFANAVLRALGGRPRAKGRGLEDAIVASGRALVEGRAREGDRRGRRRAVPPHGGRRAAARDPAGRGGGSRRVARAAPRRRGGGDVRARRGLAARDPRARRGSVGAAGMGGGGVDRAGWRGRSSSRSRSGARARGRRSPRRLRRARDEDERARPPRLLAPGEPSMLRISDPAKLEARARELSRMKLAARACHAVDWTVGSGDVLRDFDLVVFVDAPCSGVGTLRRRPDLQTRRALSRISRRSPRSSARSSPAPPDHVRPGGRLVFAVCSVLREGAGGRGRVAPLRAP